MITCTHVEVIYPPYRGQHTEMAFILSLVIISKRKTTLFSGVVNQQVGSLFGICGCYVFTFTKPLHQFQLSLAQGTLGYMGFSLSKLWALVRLSSHWR